MDISHGCFTGSIPQFDGLRLVWAQVAGYGIHDFREIGGPVMPNLDFDAYTDGDLLGDWPDGAPDDPLVILLVHREDGGRIKWQHCAYLADRLAEVEMWMVRGGTVTSFWVLMTQQFVRGLRTAAHFRQDVIFSTEVRGEERAQAEHLR